MNKNRLEAFSDGVFAIVITLLVLDIRIPEEEYSKLPELLLGLLPRVISYAMSFAIIGIYWVGHHQSFQLINKTDGGFLWLNILLLLFVSFIPFPTSLMGRYPMQSLPIFIYGANLICTNATAFAMLIYLKKHPHLSSHTNVRAHINKHFPVYLVINGSYVIAMIAGFFFPLISYLIYAGIVGILICYYGKFKIPGIN
jgi:uncharacterized membrane protein